jgi:hypothetical protein
LCLLPFIFYEALQSINVLFESFSSFLRNGIGSIRLLSDKRFPHIYVFEFFECGKMTGKVSFIVLKSAQSLTIRIDITPSLILFSKALFRFPIRFFMDNFSLAFVFVIHQASINDMKQTKAHRPEY